MEVRLIICFDELTSVVSEIMTMDMTEIGLCPTACLDILPSNTVVRIIDDWSRLTDYV